MKFKAIAFVAALAASMGVSHAGSGTFGFGIELDGTGVTATNSGTITIYALDNSGGSQLNPGGAGLLSTAWTNASTEVSPTFNLGTFVYGLNTLTLTGGSILTFKNSGSDVSSGTLAYQIIPSAGSVGTFTNVNLPFGANLTNPGDQRWDTESLSTNLLAGLNPGTYTIDVYGYANTTDGTAYENGGSVNNFAATFTVVPEPSTYAMMFGGLVALVVVQRLRRKSVA